MPGNNRTNLSDKIENEPNVGASDSITSQKETRGSGSPVNTNIQKGKNYLLLIAIDNYPG